MQNTLKARKVIVNGSEAKSKTQTTRKYNVMHRIEQVPKGVVKKQAKGKKLLG